MRLSLPLQLKYTASQFLEEITREHAIVKATAGFRPGTKIVARPNKAIEFVESQQVASLIETKRTSNRGRYLERGPGICRRTVRDRGDNRLAGSVLLSPHGNDDGTWPVLDAFDRAGCGFITP